MDTTTVEFKRLVTTVSLHPYDDITGEFRAHVWDLYMEACNDLRKQAIANKTDSQRVFHFREVLSKLRGTSPHKWRSEGDWSASWTSEPSDIEDKDRINRISWAMHPVFKDFQYLDIDSVVKHLANLQIPLPDGTRQSYLELCKNPNYSFIINLTGRDPNCGEQRRWCCWQRPSGYLAFEDGTEYGRRMKKLEYDHYWPVQYPILQASFFGGEIFQAIEGKLQKLKHDDLEFGRTRFWKKAEHGYNYPYWNTQWTDFLSVSLGQVTRDLDEHVLKVNTNEKGNEDDILVVDFD